MPHYGLVDATKMTEADAALLRSRLHLRGGKRRLQKGLTAAGIVALYDSILFGMRYYIAKHQHCASFVENTDLWDAASLFQALVRAGVFDDAINFNRFSLNVERALWQESLSLDADSLLVEVETMLTKLGVMPFNESVLPGEAPSVQEYLAITVDAGEIAA
jgi:hypothetical protein